MIFQHDIKEQTLTNTPIVVADAMSGEMVHVTAAAAALFGYSFVAEMEGQAVEILIPEKDRAKHIEDRKRYARHPEARPMGHGVPVTGLKRDGTTIKLIAGLAPLKEVHERMLISVTMLIPLEVA